MLKVGLFLGAGTSVCWVAIDRKVAGFLPLADSVRPEAASAVRALQKAGVVTAMLTGDSLGPASAIGTAVGLEQVHVHASLLPQDKFDAVHAHFWLEHHPVVVHSIQPCRQVCLCLSSKLYLLLQIPSLHHSHELRVSHMQTSAELHMSVNAVS